MATSTIPAAGSTIRFGTIRCERSVAETVDERRAEERGDERLARPAEARNEAATSSAVTQLDRRVDDADRGRRSRWQRPRSASYETTGTFSYHASSCPQLMQAEPGATIERLSGTRAATTFRKLPIARPGRERDGGDDLARSS